MKTVSIIHLGIGRVGRKVIELISGQSDAWSKEFGVDVRYCGVFTSKGGLYDAKGIPLSSIVREQIPLSSSFFPIDCIANTPKPFIVIDTTASEETLPVLIVALRRGGYVVLSNKKPLSGSQRDFNRLMSIARNRLYFETTVGAGLPAIQTLRTLLATGDTPLSIQGCLSGTLGFMCSEMEKGVLYSEAVAQAKKQGFTEPDPRDDLSGMDVARKALILGRTTGLKLELKDVQRTSLYPKCFASCSVEEFLKQAEEVNKEYGDRFAAAKKKKSTLRYIATIRPVGISVGLTEVPLSSSIGRLAGPDNLIKFETKRYHKQPLVIQGPGAGIDVTAAGVVGDIVHILQIIGCGG